LPDLIEDNKTSSSELNKEISEVGGLYILVIIILGNFDCDTSIVKVSRQLEVGL